MPVGALPTLGLAYVLSLHPIPASCYPLSSTILLFYKLYFQCSRRICFVCFCLDHDFPYPCQTSCCISIFSHMVLESLIGWALQTRGCWRRAHYDAAVVTKARSQSLPGKRRAWFLKSFKLRIAEHHIFMWNSLLKPNNLLQQTRAGKGVCQNKKAHWVIACQIPLIFP